MTDINLNTITQVTETDMGKAWEVFDQMRNAVIEGSKLSVKFQELEGKVQALSSQLDRAIETNRRMDEMYASISRQRDDAMQEASRVKSELVSAKADLERSHDRVSSQNDMIESRDQEISRLKKERDEAQFSAMEWEEKAENFRKRLDAVTAALGLPSPVQSEPQKPQHPEDEPGQPVGPLASPSTVDGGSDSGVPSSSEKPPQPRDPVTQQWRSPYEETKQMEDWDFPVQPPKSSPY